MPTVQQTSYFNIEGTISTSFNTAIAAFSLPSWLPTRPTVILDWAEIAASLPSFGVTHIPVSLTQSFQGMNVGGGKRGMPSLDIFEVSCFVSRSNNANWLAQLRTMKDWVVTWAGDTKQLVIKDYAANQSSPSDTEYLINFMDIAPLASQPDNANPGVERQRILLDYRHVHRVA